jgi:sulfite reductase alpha subunit-like flavoprotein
MKSDSVLLGPAHLFFGCRRKSTDFIFKDTLLRANEGIEESESRKVLTELHLSLSRG